MRGSARHHHGAHIRRFEHAEAGVLEVFRQFGQFQSKPEVRLVGAVAGHGVRVGDALDGRGDFDVDQSPQRSDQAFAECNHVVLFHEAGFDIQLGEFWLSVGTEILVTVTAGNLVVLLKPAHLEQLFEQLRRLWQCVPGARRQTGRHHKVARTLGGGAGQRRSLDFHVAVLVQELAGRPVGLRAEQHVGLWRRAPEVEVAVLQARFLAHLDVLVNLEGQRVRGVQHGHRLGDHLDLSGGECGVFIALGPLLHYPRDLENVFVAQAVEDVLFANNHLGKSGRIAQIKEGDATVISAAGNPACQGDGLSNVPGPQRTKVMCAQHSIPSGLWLDQRVRVYR